MWLYSVRLFSMPPMQSTLSASEGVMMVFHCLSSPSLPALLQTRMPLRAARLPDLAT